MDTLTSLFAVNKWSINRISNLNSKDFEIYNFVLKKNANYKLHYPLKCKLCVANTLWLLEDNNCSFHTGVHFINRKKWMWFMNIFTQVSLFIHFIQIQNQMIWYNYSSKKVLFSCCVSFVELSKLQ